MPYFGDPVKKGEVIGVIYDPFTGEEIDQLVANTDGYVMNTGSLFLFQGRASAVIGKLVETVNFKEYFKL